MNADESEPLPRWVMRKYAQIWKIKRDSPFTLDEVADALKEDKKILLVFLSQLRRRGWLQAESNQDDARRKIYRLYSPERVLEVMN